MSSPDAIPRLHQPLDQQLTAARLDFDSVASDLWGVVGYNQDPIAAALAAFPRAEWRRSDTQFVCTPEEEAVLRTRAARLGPGRMNTESLEDLGIFQVDAEAVEAGQLHKVVTELWRLLVTGSQGIPIIAFGSDRRIPVWEKNKDTSQEDPELGLSVERLSTDRLLHIGGSDIALSADFFRRIGAFDTEARLLKENEGYQASRRERALAIPGTEHGATEKFLRSALDETDEAVLPIGYDLDSGQVVREETGQVRRLGLIAGRQLIYVHREGLRNDGRLSTVQTMQFLGEVAATIVSRPDIVLGYWTSATYKPSRAMSGIRAGIAAAQDDRKLRLATPSYGVEDLSLIKGEEPTQPIIGNIAGEVNNAAEEAKKLRDFLDSLERGQQG